MCDIGGNTLAGETEVPIENLDPVRVCTRHEKIKQSHYRPGHVQRVPEFEAPRFQDKLHMKVVRLSALRTGRLYPQGNTPLTDFC